MTNCCSSSKSIRIRFLVTAKYLHGVALKIDDVGVLIQGKAASGKSELALGLLDRQHQFIADDTVNINTDLVMKPEEHNQGYLYIRDLGLIEVAHFYPNQLLIKGYRLELIISLQNDPAPINEHLSPKPESQTIHHHHIPSYPLCRHSTIDLSLKVESLVKQYKLLKSGYCTGRHFLNQLPA